MTSPRTRLDRDDPAVRAWSLLLRTQAALLPRLEQVLVQQAGLPLSWYDVLLELNAAPERRLRMQELGERVVLSRSRVSRIVDDLVRAGLVRREPDPDDRRGAWAVATDDGRRALRAAAPVYLRAIGEHFGRHLDAAQVGALDDALSTVLAALTSAEGAAPGTGREGAGRARASGAELA